MFPSHGVAHVIPIKFESGNLWKKGYCFRDEFELEWVPRGGVDLALAFLSEGLRFEPCRQLSKKLFQDESLDSRTR